MQLVGSALTVANPISLNGGATGATLTDINMGGHNQLTGAFTVVGNNNSIDVTNFMTADNLTITGGASGISGAASAVLNKIGTGTLTLNNNNSNYLGTTNANAGTLVIQNGNALGASSATASIASGAVLYIDSTSGSTDNLTIPNQITITGGKIIEDVANNTDTISGHIIVPTGATANINVSNGANDTLTLTGQISGSGISFNSIGVGTLNLDGNSTYTGTTNVSGGGTLELSSNNALGTKSLLILRLPVRNQH